MANSPHDALFRYTFGQPEHASGLLRSILPAQLVAEMDWTTLTTLPGTRLDDQLRRHQTDQLYSIQSAAGPVYVYVLIEHSSRVDRWMALRQVDYTAAIWRQLLREQPDMARLPWIVPIVIHHGREAWSAPSEFAELLEPGGADRGLPPPRFAYRVHSLHGMTPDEIGGLAQTLLGKLTLAFLQFIPKATQGEVAAAFARWGGLVRELLRAPSGEEAMAALSEYVLSTTSLERDSLLEVVANEVNRKGSEIMETTAQRLIRQGREEGREEGHEEGRRAGLMAFLARQLEQRFGPLPDAVRARLAAASVPEIETWGDRVLDAQTLGGVLGDS